LNPERETYNPKTTNFETSKSLNLETQNLYTQTQNLPTLNTQTSKPQNLKTSKSLNLETQPPTSQTFQPLTPKPSNTQTSKLPTTKPLNAKTQNLKPEILTSNFVGGDNNFYYLGNIYVFCIMDWFEILSFLL